MDAVYQRRDEQSRLWNGQAGSSWVKMQPLLDRLFHPFEKMLVRAISESDAGRILDVGCGTGGTTIALARELDDKGRVTGIDISAPMIEAARQRSRDANIAAEFLCENAQYYAFQPGSFDMIVSRFGMMFFDNFVQAFGNLREAAREDGAICFICWRHQDENPFMTTAEYAAAPLLPSIPKRPDDAPGQFAFADSKKIQDILEDSGWSNISIEAVDTVCEFFESELVPYFTQMGPLGTVLHEVTEELRVQIIQTVRAAFSPFVEDDMVRFNAACWLVHARAS